ncbi:unnamed protein product [Moneuplotes crassus]|uniref:Uncharacterized protein n=1 Tax=Euplotes crassus TaxID=5936 RepID=A0AAD1UIS6_EUPCR|nr:unnamed protein product [Moneuplotes crassus]
MKYILIAILLLTVVTARLHLTETQEKRLNELDPNPNHQWYTQRVDHHNPQLKETFQQRYFDNDKYWDSETGPLFLYICGEAICREPADNSFVVNLAKKFNGRVLALEHRFYGMSHPRPDWSTENLQFLTPDQALADLAQFASDKSREFSAEHGIPFRRWITVGGSYPGALSAWFRAKYPHIAFASLSSSGIVNTITDYDEYDGQVYASSLKSGEECTDKWRSIFSSFEDKINSGLASDVYEFFGYFGNDLTVGDFFNFLADISAGSVQYGKRSKFCDGLINTEFKEQDLLNWTLEYSKEEGLDLNEYTVPYFANTTIDYIKAGRQWSYQICAHIGFFQTPAKSVPSMRSQTIAIDYWRDLCQGIFGIDLFPDTDHWNKLFGGKEITGSKIIFTNGGEDPWQHSSIMESENPTFHPIVIDCDNCAHCVDLHGDFPDDAPELTAARDQIKGIFQDWISEELNLERIYPSEVKVGLREFLS